jgi:hypothetical protein
MSVSPGVDPTWMNIGKPDIVLSECHEAGSVVRENRRAAK